jgi:hypothetical protein
MKDRLRNSAIFSVDISEEEHRGKCRETECFPEVKKKFKVIY